MVIPVALKWQYSLIATVLRTIGQSSDSVALGFQRGFDSGEMMDRIYQNQPSGRLGIGWLADWLYLNQVGCKGLRGRKNLLKATLHQVVEAQRAAGLAPVILDVAAGPATYLVELLAEDGGDDVQAVARDRDTKGLRRGRRLAETHAVDQIRYEQADALDESSFQDLTPSPTIVVSSGFYEIITDDAMIRRSMNLIRGVLASDGVFIFTTQVNHPQLDLIANVLPNREGEPWVMKNRPLSQVEGWGRDAGFGDVSSVLEPHGLFGVTVARSMVEH